MYYERSNTCTRTVQLKRKTQSPCLIKDYRNAELTSSPCVYVDDPRNNMDMTDRTRCLHESVPAIVYSLILSSQCFVILICTLKFICAVDHLIPLFSEMAYILL